jgi:hypothetical protein
MADIHKQPGNTFTTNFVYVYTYHPYKAVVKAFTSFYEYQPILSFMRTCLAFLHLTTTPTPGIDVQVTVYN